MSRGFKHNGIESDGAAPRRVLVLRALKLGDLLCAVPLLRALRAAWPKTEIVLLGLPWAAQLVERYPEYVDGFREFPGWPGLPERAPEVERIPEFLREIQAERFDLVIQAHGSGPIVNPLVALLGARAIAGFYLPGDYCPDPRRFCPWPERGLEICRLLKLAEILGIEHQGEFLEFPVWASDQQRLFALPEARALWHGRYACIHAGASVPERRWPIERFAEVARRLQDDGLTIVLTGSEQERDLARAVRKAVGGAAIDLTGKTDLGALAALLQGARILICNDTGVSHLADALDVPSVVISTGENPARWAAMDRILHRTLANQAGVNVTEVVAQAHELLEFCRPVRSNWRGSLIPSDTLNRGARRCPTASAS